MLSDAALTASLTALALEAGRAIMPFYKSGCAVAAKTDQSPVTEADRNAEAVILKGLAAIAPDTPVVAEERCAAEGLPSVGEVFFLVDPLDGTREFVGGSGEFTVNIALIRNGRPVVGVVYAPAASLLYAAADGAAWRSAVGRDGVLVGRERLSARRRPEQGLVAVASRSHRSPETDAFLSGLDVVDFAPAGSSLKFCLIAEGAADVYPRLGRTMEWDTAAGQAVLEAAGGSVLVFPDGPVLSYGKRARGYDNPHFIAWGAR